MTIIPTRPIPVTPGVTYYGTATVNFPASIVVTSSKIKSKLASMGFTNIAVSEVPPADWPTSEQTGDYFVKATYSDGSGATIPVPAQVTAVWTGTS